MIHALQHSFRPWKMWAGGIILIGFVLVSAQCSPSTPIVQATSTATPTLTLTATSTPTATPTENPPPEITGLTPIPPGPVLVNDSIRIQVNVNRNGHKIKDFRWIVEVGGGNILQGQGDSIITYQAPGIPGRYEVSVQLVYEGGIIEESKLVKVVQPAPTETPTPTSTYTPPPPTNTPTPTPTDTPQPPTDTPVPPTPTPTPTPTLVPELVLIAPENGFPANGARPDLIWKWDGDMTKYPNYYFQVNIWLQGQSDPIDVAWVRYPCYRYDQVPEGIEEGQNWVFEWNVDIVEGNHGIPKNWSPVQPCDGWHIPIEVWNPGLITETQRISEISEQRSVEIVVENPSNGDCPPGVSPCPPDGDDDDGGGVTGGKD